MIRYSFGILLLISFNSCNNTSEETTSKPTEGTIAKAESTELTRVDAQKHYVSITGMKFIPEVIEVNKGDTIVFDNTDIVNHDVTEEKTKAWTSSVIPSGKSWRMIATESTDYFCSIHEVMKGKIVVK
jgi:plastocyanin